MANAYIDQPSEVRKSDALNNELLEQYVRKTISGLTGSMQVKQFKGGASNLTYQLDFDNRSIILRCPPPGTKAKSAHDMGREFNIMQKLKPVFPFVPEMIVHCTDETLIGREFYLMEKLNGIIPRANFPKGLQLSPKQCRELCIHFVDKLIALHSVDIKQCGLDTIGKGSGYVARQINGWSERYTKALTPNVATGEGVMNWLKKKMPEDVSSCLIHGDYRLDNAVLNPNNPVEITAILDWEMATIGDPLMD